MAIPIKPLFSSDLAKSGWPIDFIKRLFPINDNEQVHFPFIICYMPAFKKSSFTIKTIRKYPKALPQTQAILIPHTMILIINLNLKSRNLFTCMYV